MRERINIAYKSDDERGRDLSNLSDFGFCIGDIYLATFESFLQGCKLPFDDPERAQVFAMRGIDALKFVRSKMPEGGFKTFNWDGKEVPYNSPDHRLILADKCCERIRQNPPMQRSLLATRGAFIYHDVGEENPTTSFPEPFYIEVLLSYRKLLERLERISA